MTHLKRLSHQMHRICKLKKIIISLLIFTLLPLTSCKKDIVETITLREWLKVLTQEAGIINYDEETPYFSNVTSSDTCYANIQAAVEWGVLEPMYGFHPDEILTNEWTAYTLINLTNKIEYKNIHIVDISESIFESQIQRAINSELMNIDAKSMFHPQQIIEKDKALKLLEQSVSYINHKNITEFKSEIDWDSDAPIEIDPVYFDKDNSLIKINDSEVYEEDVILHWYDEFIEYYYQVDHQQNDTVYLKEINLLEKTNTMNLSGSSELDFSNVMIIDGNNNVIEETSCSNKLEQLSTRKYQKSFNLNDFKVSISTSSSTVKAEVSKTLPLGSSVYASMKVSGVKCDYQWNSKKEDIHNAYFKVKFHSEEDVGLKNGSYKNLYGDFSQFSADDFLNSIGSMFKEKKDVLESTLNLCQIKVPIPNAPLMNITLNLELHMYVSGRVEIVLSQDSELGCEVKDNKIRMIKSYSHQENNRFKATTEARAGIVFGLNLVSLRLMDVAVNASASASLKTQLHLYKDAEHRIIETDVSADVASELSDSNPNVLVCNDINANLSLYLKLNSSKSQLGKFGLSSRIDLLKTSLIPKGKTHMENFQFVSKCTRKDRIILNEAETITVSKKIKLEDYSFVVKVSGERQIVVKGLPEGYEKEDLLYTSDNETIAIVDSTGVVSGISQGAAVITVTTNDNAHYIKCNVIVTGVKS